MRSRVGRPRLHYRAQHQELFGGARINIRRRHLGGAVVEVCRCLPEFLPTIAPEVSDHRMSLRRQRSRFALVSESQADTEGTEHRAPFDKARAACTAPRCSERDRDRSQVVRGRAFPVSSLRKIAERKSTRSFLRQRSRLFGLCRRLLHRYQFFPHSEIMREQRATRPQDGARHQPNRLVRASNSPSRKAAAG